MAKHIITVSRQFGSGGRSIGKALAQRLGVAYYDKELVKEVAVKSGFDPAFVEERGEFAPMTSSLAYAFAASQGVPGVMNGLSASDYLWIIQRNVILDVVSKGPCVIVGRCADYILRDRTDCLNAFIYADMDYRAERIVRLYGESEKSPVQRLQDKDKKRRVSYKHYTGQEWGMAENYHLCLNSGVLGEEQCVDILEQAAQKSR